LLNDQLRVLLPAMPAFWSGSGLDMLSETAASIALRLAGQQIRHFRTTELEQSPAWEDSIAAVQRAVSVIPQAAGWRVLLEYPIIRLGRRIDAVLVTPHAVLVLEFKREQADIASRAQVEDYALDLFDFHELSRRQPVVPILVSGGVRRTSAMPLVMHGVTTVLQTSEDGLADLLRNVVARCAIMGPPLDPATWEAGAYRPVPTIVEAACMAYSRNGVADIREARADRRNLHATTSAGDRAGRRVQIAPIRPRHRACAGYHVQNDPVRDWYSWCRQDFVRAGCRVRQYGDAAGHVPDRQPVIGACVARGAGAGRGGERRPSWRRRAQDVRENPAAAGFPHTLSGPSHRDAG
jgi:hypothetical protein